VGSSGARQVDHPLVVLRWSSCKQMHITYKLFQIGAYDLRVEYSEMNDGSSVVSLKPIAPGMAEFWASTGGRMVDMLLAAALVIALVCSTLLTSCPVIVCRTFL